MRSRIGDVAAGKTIDRILVAYDNPDGPARASRAGSTTSRSTGSPASRERRGRRTGSMTTRGTNSSGSFSRGNNIPATAVPHGFNFWTPMTNAGTLSWLYEYQKANNADNLPTLQAFAASHEPSPWMGDRQTFQVMPSVRADAGRRPRGACAAVPARQRGRAAALLRRHVRERARDRDRSDGPRGALPLRVPRRTSSLIFDNVNNDARPERSTPPPARCTGWSDVRSGLSNGATRMFMYATFDKPIKASGMLPSGNRPTTGFVRFDAKTVNMRIATSLISVAQAKHNLELELRRSTRSSPSAAAPSRRGTASSGSSTSRARPRTSAPRCTRTCTGCSCIRTRRSRTPAARASRSTATRCSRRPTTAGEHADADRRTDRQRQGLRQQRVLGHLPDHVVGVRPVLAADGRRARRRLRPAVPRRRLDRALVLAGLREPDDGHLVRRLVRRRLRQGRAGLRRARRLRRGAQERDRRAAGRSVRPKRRPQGPVALAVPRLHAATVSEGVSWALEGDINDFGISNMAGKLAAGRRRRPTSGDSRRRRSTSAAGPRTT